jgi:hypothetical protein
MCSRGETLISPRAWAKNCHRRVTKQANKGYVGPPVGLFANPPKTTVKRIIANSSA